MKLKGLFPLVMTYVMLSSTVGEAAVSEQVEPEAQTTAAINTDQETSIDMTEEETEENREEETEEISESETDGTEEEETSKEAESEIETATKEENEPEAEEKTENLNDELLVDFKSSDVRLSTNLMFGIHEHSWSVDWNYNGGYHWHECDAEDCSVSDNSEKDGYAEHELDDHGICTECGYDAMDGIAVAAEGNIPTYQEVYEAMTALKEIYPEGMTWTNFEPYGSRGDLGSEYTWKGGVIYGAKSAVGCMAFTFILSDEAFDNLPARAIKKGSFSFEDVKVGDILRVNGNSHSVIVLQKSVSGVTVAEGNYNKSVHWGRAMSPAEVENADFIVTRYPEGYVPSDDVEADEIVQSGTEGNVEWSLTNGGVLTISGDGTIPDYSSDTTPPWSGYYISTIIIEEGVTGIGDNAFYQSQALSVTISETVKTIGNSAFYDCQNLISATVSEGVEIIGENAFRGCTALTYIDFPASITSVGSGAFMGCNKITSVRFMSGSDTVKLGDGLFAQCQNLISVTLPRTADCISANMFSSCSSLPELYIPASVKQIGENPFTSCKGLKKIYFGGSEAEWNRIASPYLTASLKSTGTQVVYDAVFKDPFATDSDDPGDFHPEETEPSVPDETDKPEETEPSVPDETDKPEETEPSVPDETDKPEETEPSVPDETDKPEETEPSVPEETPSTPEEITTPDTEEEDDSDDDYYYERETILTSREERLVENVLGISAVKEVTENESGKLIVSVNTEVVFMEKNGTLSKDKWQQVGGSWYFFDKDSKAAGGWLEQNGKWYYLNESDKKMETGWLKTADGKWYLLDQANGDMKTGWQQTKDGKWYLFDQINGDMKTGWQQTKDGKWYLLDQTNGDMKTGWQMVRGIWYYLDPLGAMAEDTITPDGYRVGKNGAWTGEKVR